jgi:cysteine synthase
LPSIKISKYIEWTCQRGIGQTEIAELPEEINPYAKHGIYILYKKEYTNPGGNAKDRSASFMLWVYNQLGLLDEKERITIAGAGNFAKSIAIYAKEISPHIKRIESRMGYVAIERNPDLIEELDRLGVTIVGCKDTQCPSVVTESGKPVERGKAITDSWIEEVTNPTTTVFLDQHGFWKSFDAILNTAGYYYTLGPEIINQIKKLFGDVPFEFCQGMGTRGSLIGTSVRLLKNDSRTKIFAHIPKSKNGAPTFQFGLRTREELGIAHTLDSVNKICDRIYETSDKDAAKMFITLLEYRIPACPSFAGNIVACLKRAKELYKEGKDGVIVTLAFDGPYHYKRFLEKTLPSLLKKDEFSKYSTAFEDVVSIAEKEKNMRMV